MSTDKSLWDLVKEQLKIDGKMVEVGFFEDATYKDGTPVAQVAIWNEYGTTHKARVQSMGFRENKKGRMVFASKDKATFEQDLHIGDFDTPPRPFMRLASSKYSDEALNVGARVIAKGGSMSKALGSAAEFMVGGIVQEITDLDTPPNAPSVIRKKGKSDPLVNTGWMRRKVTYKFKG